MALLSDLLSTAVGFSGACGSCLHGGRDQRTTLIKKRNLSIRAVCFAAVIYCRNLKRESNLSQQRRQFRKVMKCDLTRQQRQFLVKMDMQANKTRWILPEDSVRNGIKGIRRQIGGKCADKDVNK